MSGLLVWLSGLALGFACAIDFRKGSTGDMRVDRLLREMHDIQKKLTELQHLQRKIADVVIDSNDASDAKVIDIK